MFTVFLYFNQIFYWITSLFLWRVVTKTPLRGAIFVTMLAFGSLAERIYIHNAILAGYFGPLITLLATGVLLKVCRQMLTYYAAVRDFKHIKNIRDKFD